MLIKLADWILVVIFAIVEKYYFTCLIKYHTGMHIFAIMQIHFSY